MSTTLLHRLENWAEATPHAPAQRFKTHGEWRTISAEEYRDRVHHLALFLDSRGFTPDEGGVILSYNCPEWVHVDLAILAAGARSAGIYPNSTPKEIQYILEHSEASVLAVQNKEYFKKITGENGEHPLPERIKMVIVFDGDTSIHPKAVAYQTAISEGRKLASQVGSQKFSDFLEKLDPNSGRWMIYTSGTTGNPKGALLSQDNFCFTSDMVTRWWKLPFARGTMFSFLPLCHVAEKLQSVAVGISNRYTISFASKFENVSTELPEVQPTLLLCVPRLWEKMMEGVLHKIKGGKGAKQKLAYWALETGKRVAEARSAGRTPSLFDQAQFRLADKLVLSKVREALGLAKAEMLASGAAALPAHVSRWFRALGVEIQEDYGQTETTGVICMTELGQDSAGTVGKPVPGMEVTLANDGEILTRGRHVFVGYFKNDEATAQTLVDGWCRTGDLGEWDERKLLCIRGRKKEVMKTSGGKMVAPLPIEEQLKAASMISQVCLVGDGRKYLSALVTLSEPTLQEVEKKNSEAKKGLVVTDKDILGKIKKHVEDLNKNLASYEQIKRFTVLAKEFSINDGEMTPTLKMKRNVIEQRYRELIGGMYAGASS